MKYLDHYKYLQSSEIAQLTNRSIKQVNRWRVKANKQSTNLVSNGWGNGLAKRPFVGTKPKPYPIIEITDPKIWDNEAWFRDTYETKRLGMFIISKIIKRNLRCVHGRIKKYGIKSRTKKESSQSKNPCCNLKWLDENYVIQEMSLAKCAKLANVNSYTIMNWLTNFGIHIRDRYEALAGQRNASYGRKYPKKIDSTKNDGHSSSRPDSNKR